MVYRLAVLWEVFSIVVCIHRIYNKRVKLDIETIGLSLMTIGIFELSFLLNVCNAASLFAFVFMIIYCMRKFKDGVWGATVSTLLMLIVIGILQFLFLLPFSRINLQHEAWRMLIINVMITGFSLCFLPKMKVHRLREIIRRRDKFIAFAFLVVLLVITLITVEGKMQGDIHVAFYVFTVPVLILLLVTLCKWEKVQNEKEFAQNELLVTKSMQEEYNNLLTSVRLREHGFKNHLAALLSLRYTSKSYEELVKEQDNYYGIIREENRYNKLLFLGDSTISGFLYEKLSQAEDTGVSVTYEILGCFLKGAMPIYHVIEILGILFDNAIEAQIEMVEAKRLRFQFEEKEMVYVFSVMNPYPYVKYTEIESWFLQNYSKKGKERGLGLYYVKTLCEEYDASILCRNIEHEQENWIEMTLEIRKADKS